MGVTALGKLRISPKLFFRKRLDAKLQSESASGGKNKRDADVEGTDEPIFGKKPRIEDSINEDLR